MALPEPKYLARIGEIAYTVSSMEWTLLGDLHRLAADLPAPLTLKELEPQTTGAIGACASRAAAMGMALGPVREFIAVCGTPLAEAAKIRNDVLHARPATHPEQDQRLSHAGTRREARKFVLDGTRFWITDEWLDDQIRRLNELLDNVNHARAALPPQRSSRLSTYGTCADLAPVTSRQPHGKGLRKCLRARYAYPERDHTSCLPVSMTSKGRPPIPAPGTTPSARQPLAQCR
ncbi:hypothetical protein Csp1_03710 [Corynebacterium provencense]|uniref:Uncharacterized protein n=1 Tax=Corynebacterium provencense TaxID=1737425 RepID=A0A2Z3YLQ2_9CORY|nr:hypothetical protein Csp1_03710 [Corynebacterium provencense]